MVLLQLSYQINADTVLRCIQEHTWSSGKCTIQECKH